MAQFIEKKRTAFLGLPLFFTTYTITDELLTIKEGLLKITENDCYLYKIQDVTLTRTLMERMFGLGTITCHTGDTTNPVLELKHIKNASEIKDYILRVSDELRLKRRTINTVNIGAESLEDALNEE